MVFSCGSHYSYIDEDAVSEREKKISDEVNQHTKNAPFTVLFTGHVPKAIQEKRLCMLN